MTTTDNTPDLESRIIEQARQLFLEKGFTATSMSEIAAKVGINRPTLHYYFRTKERMFDAVFGDIIQQIAPRVMEVVLNDRISLNSRIHFFVDEYYNMLLQHPYLPMFVIRELNRNTDSLVKAVRTTSLNITFESIMETIRREMVNGKIRRIPLEVIFHTFYGLLLFPFITRPLIDNNIITTGKTFEQTIEQWKPYVIDQITHLLTPNIDV